MIPLSPFGLVVTAGEKASLDSFSGPWLKETLRKEKLVLFRGFDALPKEKLLDFCHHYPEAELLHWATGPVMEMRPDPNAKNYLFTEEAVPFHWDGAFFKTPSFLVFNCLEAPPQDAGGETLFCDTEKLYSSLSTEEQEAFERIQLTYETEKLAHYGGRTTGSLVQVHPQTGVKILRYAEPVTSSKNPVSLEIKGTAIAKDQFISQMKERIYSPQFCFTHRWKAGDLLIADNHALIHGRNAFLTSAPRHLRRVQIL